MTIQVQAARHRDEIVTDDVLKRGISKDGDGRIFEVCATRVRVISSPLPSFLITLEDGAGVLLPIHLFPEFRGLSSEELSQVELGFAGSALVIERRDLHVSIAGMIRQSKSLAALLGAISG